MTTASLRIFIGIEIPGLIRDAILEHAAPMRAGLSESLVRWVAPENLHLTLKFLGDTPLNRVDSVARSLMRTAAETDRFAVRLGGFGSFPTPKRPRIIWVGLHPPQRLVALQKAIESALLMLGYAGEERPFAPHLTIGRIKQPVSAADGQALSAVLEQQTQVSDLGVVEIDTLHLYKSDLRAGGSIYTKLSSAPLKILGAGQRG